MDSGIYILIITVLIFSLAFGMIDLNRTDSMKQNMFEAVRSANQNALILMEADYEAHTHLTTARMLETWLCEFAKEKDIKYEELKLSFVQIETEPPLYLVYVEGFGDEFAILSGNAYASYYSGSTIITK